MVLGESPHVVNLKHISVPELKGVHFPLKVNDNKLSISYLSFWTLTEKQYVMFIIIDILLTHSGSKR